MNLILFTESRQCEKRRIAGRCGICRSDARWRASLTTVFALPDGDVQFECPHGVQWINRPRNLPGGYKGRRRRVTAGVELTPEEAAEQVTKQKRNKRRLGLMTMRSLGWKKRDRVKRRGAICLACAENCAGVSGKYSRCRLEGCGGVDLSVAGFACQAGHWGHEDG